MTENAWTLQTGSDGTATLVLDVPGRSANTLSAAVLRELATVLDRLEAAPPTGLVVRSGKPGGFIAGADVHEFTRLTDESAALAQVRLGQGLCDRLEALPCTTVAVLNGFVLGGGLELALACRYRVGVDDGRLSLGLPEVQLGIHPGFGGTVRAVRLLGVRPAMDLMLTGKTIRADRAVAIGLVDRLAKPESAETAARSLLHDRPAPRRPSIVERLLSWAPVRPFITPALLRQVGRRVRREHYPAPYAIVELWRRHGAHGRVAFDDEARSIAGLFQTSTARNLVRVFQLQDRLKGLAGRGDGVPVVRRVHVVGAGVMGGDIAAWCALRGLDVTLQDRAAEHVDPAIARAQELFAKRTRSAEERGAAASRLKADVAGTGVATADLVIEAIYENREAKQALYAAVEPQLAATAVLATNTSSLALESLAATLARPSRLVGLHFFNPVAQMPLVEVIRGADTAPEAVRGALAFARRIDKLPLPCRSAPGFLVNRVLMPYLQEAMLAHEAGIPAATIDAVATRWGMPMGPLELADTVGLDVCRKVGQIVADGLGRGAPPPMPTLDALVEAGHLGRKSGQGFYRWDAGKVVKPAAGASGGDAVPDDLEDRLVLVLVNEAMACLREQVVEDADLVDAGIVFGAGFAPFRGGPLNWAREAGVASVVARLETLQRRHGDRFRADEGWSRFAGDAGAATPGL